MTREKIKQRALAPLARDLESAIALFTNINQQMLDAMRGALGAAYEAGLRAPRSTSHTGRFLMNEMETAK